MILNEYKDKADMMALQAKIKEGEELIEKGYTRR